MALFGFAHQTIEPCGSKLTWLNCGYEFPEKVGVLRAETDLGEHAFHIGDGQTRFFALYSMEFATKEEIHNLKKKVAKAEKAREDARALKTQLQNAERLLERIRNFLKDMQLPIVIYARERLPDGTVLGLDEVAEKRLHVEGNSLNNKAAVEEQLKYDTISPVAVALSKLRLELNWMAPDYIEENSKSLPKTSAKLFTLSALSQAYSLSTTNDPKPITLDQEAFEVVSEHQDFAAAFWTKATDVFGPLWRPAAAEELSAGAWLEYLGKRRREQNVALQAIFLQALGKLGYHLGTLALWKPDSNWLNRLELLRPRDEQHASGIDYRAFVGKFDPQGNQVVENTNDFDSKWTNAMMKPKTDGDKVVGYNFNNVHDSVNKTCALLKHLAQVPDGKQEEPDEAVEHEEALVG
jgi:hypothetical protein